MRLGRRRAGETPIARRPGHRRTRRPGGPTWRMRAAAAGSRAPQGVERDPLSFLPAGPPDSSKLGWIAGSGSHRGRHADLGRHPWAVAAPRRARRRPPAGTGAGPAARRVAGERVQWGEREARPREARPRPPPTCASLRPLPRCTSTAPTAWTRWTGAPGGRGARSGRPARRRRRSRQAPTARAGGHPCSPRARPAHTSTPTHPRCSTVREQRGNQLTPEQQAAYHHGSGQLYLALRAEVDAQLQKFEAYALETCLHVPAGLLAASVRLGLRRAQRTDAPCLLPAVWQMATGVLLCQSHPAGPGRAGTGGARRRRGRGRRG